MAKVEEPGPPGWDEPPRSIHAPRPRPIRHLRSLGLRHIMTVLVFFAVLFWAIRLVIDTNEILQQVILGMVIGLGLCGFGLWAVKMLPRLSILGWIFFVGGYMTFTLATASFFALPVLPILIGCIIYLTLRRRSNDQDALLWVMAVAAERRMPLAPGVLAFSGQVSGIFAVWADSLAELLRRGEALPEALDRLPKLAPPGASLLIRMGWESDNLGGGLREAIDARAGRLPVLRTLGARLAYICWIITVGSSIVGFIMYFIVPKFEAIFKDFGIELPEVTLLVIRSSHVFIEYSWVFSLVLIGLAGYLARVVFGSGDRSVPVFDRLFARRHSILIFRALAVVLDANRPIAPALFSLGQWYPTNWVRKRLMQAADRTNEGVGWIEAMGQTGLLSPSDVGVLNSAQRVGNLPWALRELADTGERRWGYRLHAWSQVLFVLAIVVLGGMVFLLAAAYFVPLTTLILRLSR